jgi:hypothetical protein
MTLQTRHFLAALALGSVVGCSSGSSNREESTTAQDRQESEEGKMSEWLGRGIGETPAGPGTERRQTPMPVAPNRIRPAPKRELAGCYRCSDSQSAPRIYSRSQ